MKYLNFNKKIKIIDNKKLNKLNLDNKSINLIDIQYNTKKAFEKISNKSNIYIKNSFDIAFKIIKNGHTKKLINGPISKKNFLNNKHLGIRVYFR